MKCRVRFMDDQGCFAACTVDAQKYFVWRSAAQIDGFTIKGERCAVQHVIEHSESDNRMVAEVQCMFPRKAVVLEELPEVRGE